MRAFLAGLLSVVTVIATAISALAEEAPRPNIIYIVVDDMGWARITELAREMAPPLLLLEAVRLTFYAPPVTADPAVMFNAGD